jgi:hypothetical protein
MGEVRVRVKRRPTNEIVLISFYQRKTSIPQRRVLRHPSIKLGARAQSLPVLDTGMILRQAQDERWRKEIACGEGESTKRWRNYVTTMP